MLVTSILCLGNNQCFFHQLSPYVGVVLQIVEAYLSMEQVTCNQLQLIGITAVLLATRCVLS